MNKIYFFIFLNLVCNLFSAYTYAGDPCRGETFIRYSDIGVNISDLNDYTRGISTHDYLKPKISKVFKCNADEQACCHGAFSGLIRPMPVGVCCKCIKKDQECKFPSFMVS